MGSSLRITSVAWGIAAFSALIALGAVALEVDGGSPASDAGVESVTAVPPAPAEQVAVADAGFEEDAVANALEQDDVLVPSRISAPPIATVKPLAAASDLIALAHSDAKTGRLVVKTGETEHTLTIDAVLQAKLNGILKNYETPYAAVVAIEPHTGRVLAMAEHSEADPNLRGLAVKAIFPAASVFKIVTATALLDKGLTPETSECFHGGKRRITEKHLEDSSRDSICMTMKDALAFSANGVFAKLTYKNLTATLLKSWAERFHFNQPLDFPVPADTSLASFPDEPLALAQTGAGFGDVFLSPLHGAALASVAANDGLWRNPILFEDQKPPEPTRVMTKERARTLTEMLEQTVAEGTARRIFRERGFKVSGAVGKTGSLADKKPFRDYSWFVGFAPKDNPKVAVAAVIVNDMKWRIRATWLAREAMRLYLEEQAKAAK